MEYNICMIKLIITENQGNQRLDRFLKKYFEKAPLSLIYRMIRKDIKLNGKRAKEDTMLAEGDELAIYMTEEEAQKLQETKKRVRAKRQFKIAYEDDNLLIVSKPFGLLTHGDSHEKKNHLANQVIDYLITEGKYDPSADRTFTPAPANRIDRNTTGLVIFAKNPQALREINALLRAKNFIGKYYLTVLTGSLKEDLDLRGSMIKDEKVNRTLVLKEGSEDAKDMETLVHPLMQGACKGRKYTLAEVRILTGRTHQIRAQLSSAGYPLLGDHKYGGTTALRTTQLLHSYKLVFGDIPEGKLSYLSGKVIKAEPPADFKNIANNIFGNIEEVI